MHLIINAKLRFTEDATHFDLFYLVIRIFLFFFLNLKYQVACDHLL